MENTKGGDAMPELLTANQAGAELRLTGRRVRQLLDKGLIKGQKVGRDWAISRQALEEYKQKKNK
jgi:excisionase family DNA binding protein